MRLLLINKYCAFLYFLSFVCSIALISCLYINTSQASTWVVPDNGDLVGKLQFTYPEPGETLRDIGLRYDMGYHDMVLANQQVDPVHPLSTHVRILIPSQHILPSAPRHGVVINLAEYRLYFFPEGENVVMTYPIGIGREGWPTPLGLTKIIEKQVNPAWVPTDKERHQAEKQGLSMPDAFPAGSINPLGKHVLRLGWPTYLIHGTFSFGGVGERVSAGCIRMLPADIEYLFEWVPKGTSVRIINEPIKIGMLHQVVYVEVHPYLKESHGMGFKQAWSTYNTKTKLNREAFVQAMNHPTGIPSPIFIHQH